VSFWKRPEAIRPLLIWGRPARTIPPKRRDGAGRERPAPENMKVLKIWVDDYSNPREFDTRYDLGDRHNFETPEDYREQVKSMGLAVELPLYLYDHSGITISTEGWRYPYNDRWDAGQVGWIYATQENVRKWFGIKRLTKEIMQQAEDILRGEVEEYDRCLRGDVYGYTLYDMDAWECLDSCGGFFGSDPSENGMANSVPEEFRAVLNEMQVFDGLVILEDGRMFDCRTEGSEVISAILPAHLISQYRLVRELIA